MHPRGTDTFIMDKHTLSFSLSQTSCIPPFIRTNPLTLSLSVIRTICHTQSLSRTRKNHAIFLSLSLSLIFRVAISHFASKRLFRTEAFCLAFLGYRPTYYLLPTSCYVQCTNVLPFRHGAAPFAKLQHTLLAQTLLSVVGTIYLHTYLLTFFPVSFFLAYTYLSLS